MNRNYFTLLSIIFIIMVFHSHCTQQEVADEERMALAIKICQDNILLDSHIDWPESLFLSPRNISEKNEIGDFDLIRANQGGLNAVFSVLYINSNLDVKEGRMVFDSLYKIVTSYPENYPDKFASAFSPADVKRNFKKGLISTPLCLENGSIIGNDIDFIKYLKELGIVYITLNHDKANQISDANMHATRPWKGLSPFGYEMIDEMNRQGIIIDISHSTDSTVLQVLRRSRAPIVATHSSCRHFTPGYERNLSDTLIKEIARKDGVIMIAFGSMFLDSTCNKHILELMNYFESKGLDRRSDEGMQYIQEYIKSHKVLAQADRVADHIDHVVKIAGIDHVGIGSDFDGVGPTQPIGLPDVSAYPVIVEELLRRGYTVKDIQKILSKNFLSVWDKVIDISRSPG